MDRDGFEVHQQAKKERGRNQAIFTEKTWSIKDMFDGFASSPERARSAPSCPLGYPISAQDLIHLTHSWRLKYDTYGAIGYKDCTFESRHVHVGTVLRMTITSFQIVSSFKIFLSPLMFGLIGFDRGKTRKNKKRKSSSLAKNRTPVTRVTGGDTHHYTTEDLIVKRKFMTTKSTLLSVAFESGFKIIFFLVSKKKKM